MTCLRGLSRTRLGAPGCFSLDLAFASLLLVGGHRAGIDRHRCLSADEEQGEEEDSDL